MEIIEAGEGAYKVTLEVECLQNGDLWVGLYGGELSHVGGVVLAVPSATEEGIVRCDISQICAPTHKDVYAAAQVAKMLAKATNKIVSVTAGIHVDNADGEEIAQLMKNVEACANKWISSHVS